MPETGLEEASDRDLVADYLRRFEQAAFLSLYRRHTPALFGLASRLCSGERTEAEEIVQEAWMRAAESLASFHWSSSLRTWLCGIVVNGWRERTRSLWRERAREEASAVSASAAPPIAARVDLARAVARLPDGFRAVLLLHDVEGFTHEEIAQLLRIETGTSKSQLARARASLRRMLGGRVA